MPTIKVTYSELDDTERQDQFDHLITLLNNYLPTTKATGDPGTYHSESSDKQDKCYQVLLWTAQAVEDPLFKFHALTAERSQVEQRVVVCVNVILEKKIELIHIKQKVRLLQWYEGGKSTNMEELAKQIIKEIEDKKSNVTQSVGNVSEGLVWNYFTMYLRTILPEIKEKVEKFKNDEKVTSYFSTTYFIIIPESGKCLKTLAESDDDEDLFKATGKLDNISKNDAGVSGRPFDPQVYCVRESISDDWVYFSGEYANPVATIQKLEENQIIGKEDTKYFIDKFTNRLQYILDHKLNASGFQHKYKLLRYDDAKQTDGPLHKFITKQIQEDMQQVN